MNPRTEGFYTSPNTSLQYCAERQSPRRDLFGILISHAAWGLVRRRRSGVAGKKVTKGGACFSDD